MSATVEPPAESSDEPAKPSRRARWIAAFAAGGALVVVGVAVALSKNDAGSGSSPTLSLVSDVAKTVSAAQTTTRAGHTLDHPVKVKEHPRQQAYGPGYSQRREIIVAEHTRGPIAA